MTRKNESRTPAVRAELLLLGNATAELVSTVEHLNFSAKWADGRETPEAYEQVRSVVDEASKKIQQATRDLERISMEMRPPSKVAEENAPKYDPYDDHGDDIPF